MLDQWTDVVKRIKSPSSGQVTIALVGKYTDYKDAYKSLAESLIHGGIANDVRVGFRWVDSEDIEVGGIDRGLLESDGILVPGGFGHRGIEGKIATVRYAREKGIPYFGICLGMQCAVIEFARNVCGLDSANSTEFDEHTPDPVIYLMQTWYDHRQNTVQERNMQTQKGGSMRLGSYPCVLMPGSYSHQAYESPEISERHRHRYEFNNAYRHILGAKGLLISGLSPDKQLVEIVELPDHPWFVGCQFHPEFKSRPTDPHPLFRAFIAAALREKRSLFP
ncbi:CTP synthetase [Candidatus Magnetobacterium bavaricum]|uniref:CTP synthase (glutamine hydrolyzing) n=1 Tax=Candidatus Magnetobacterium bavaricum TaxID=29290 RepID=A0A0F3GY40_9BACT|nr:CTP synthetase [Candidatus Magnetobacterium bavaricum]